MVIGYVPSHRAVSEPAPDDLCVPVTDRAVFLLARTPTPGGDEPTGDAATGWTLATLATVTERGWADIAPIGSFGGRPVWAVTSRPDEPWPGPGLSRLSWTECTDQPDADLTLLAARAIAVTSWRRTHRFCGACRTELVDVTIAVGRTCPSCGLHSFAKAQPVALIAVWRWSPAGRREVLLARHTYGGAKGQWALVGGYVDPAESLERAARREVSEEVGLTVTDLTYVESQAWGIDGPDVLLTAFTARSADPVAEPVVDGHEIGAARFFPLDDLPENAPPGHLIAGRTLAHLAAQP